jgi:hypothetical protein
MDVGINARAMLKKISNKPEEETNENSPSG